MKSIYPTKRATLLPKLWEVHERDGWISPEAMERIAGDLEITAAEVEEVVSFYTMFARKPIGQHHIQVCRSICCRLRGSDDILAYLKDRLGIDVNQTTEDGRFHLSTVECLGSCGTAPMMQIDNDYYENLDTAKIDEIIKRMK